MRKIIHTIIRKNLHRPFVLLTAGLVLFSSTIVCAQILDADDALVARKREVDHDSAQGIRAGAFIFSQGLNLHLMADDNVFRTNTNTESDFVTRVKPALAVQSDWNRHSVFLGLKGDLGYYRENSSENFKDHGVMLSGHYDIAPETWLFGAFSRVKRHEGRGSILQDTNRKLDYIVTTSMLEFTRALSYIKLKLRGENEDVHLSKDENPALAGGDDYRARDTQTLGGTIAYEYMPLNEIFLSAVYDTTDYSLITGGAGRGSHGTDTRLGIKFNNARALNASLYGGYLERNFDGGGRDLDRFYIGGSAVWNVTKLSSLAFTWDKNFVDTTLGGSGGAIHTIRRLIGRHSFTPHVNGEISTGIDTYDYFGPAGTLGSARLYYGGVAAEYEVTPGLEMRAGYDHTRRAASSVVDKYNDNRVIFSINYMY